MGGEGTIFIIETIIKFELESMMVGIQLLAAAGSRGVVVLTKPQPHHTILDSKLLPDYSYYRN